VFKNFLSICLATLFLLAAVPGAVAQDRPRLGGSSRTTPDRDARIQAMLIAAIRHELLTLPYYDVFDCLDGEILPMAKSFFEGKLSGPQRRKTRNPGTDVAAPGAEALASQEERRQTAWFPIVSGIESAHCRAQVQHRRERRSCGLLLFLFTHVRATLEAMPGSPSMPSRQCAPHSPPPSPSLVPRLPRCVRAVPLLPMRHLLSGSVPFKPDPYSGQKVRITGVLIRQPNNDRISVTSLEMVAATCP